jgi:NlpC/P60 family putative phage cell wall peptidase
MSTTVDSVDASLQTRECLVTEARSWIGTPYRLGGRVKGAGCDCATFLAEVLIACGLAEREELGVYSHDWFHHSGEDRYKLRILRHAVKTMEAVAYRSLAVAPGNLVLTSVAHSKVYNHAGVITAWPRLVHAVAPHVIETDASRDPMWTLRHIVVFDPFAEKPGA